MARRWAGIVATAAAVGAGALVATAARPADAASTIGCRYVITATWPGGFQADLYITNNGPTAISGWTARWTFNEPTRNVQGWNATLTTQGDALTATGLPWNSTIWSGATAAFGWTATATSTSVPGDITVNGIPC